MDEELKDMTRETLGHVLEWVESAEGFVAEQAPLLCQEIVRWGIVGNLFEVFVGLLLTITSALIARRLISEFRTNAHWDKSLTIFGYLPLLMWIISVPTAFISAHAVLKVLVAPRLYILERLAWLMS